MSYSDLLKDPRWQRKRLEVMNAAGWKCVVCGSTTKTLNVHHKQYVRGRMPWEYDLTELQCLCEDCHKAEHGLAEPFVQSSKRSKLDGSQTRGASAEREVVRLVLHRPEFLDAAVALFQADEPSNAPLRVIFDALRDAERFRIETGIASDRDSIEAAVFNEDLAAAALLSELYDETDGLDHADETMTGASTVLTERRLRVRSAQIDAEMPSAPDDRKDDLTREKMEIFAQLRKMESGWWRKFR